MLKNAMANTNTRMVFIVTRSKFKCGGQSARGALNACFLAGAFILQLKCTLHFERLRSTATCVAVTGAP
jgi:hypothetical protein